MVIQDYLVRYYQYELCCVCRRGGRSGAYDRESVDNGPAGPARWSDSRDGGPRSANFGSSRWDDRPADSRYV